MPKVVAQPPCEDRGLPQVELDLALDQVVAIVHQLAPDEQERVRQATEPLPWSRRMEALLTRVSSRVESHPIAEEDVEAEVERARAGLGVPGGR